MLRETQYKIPVSCLLLTVGFLLSFNSVAQPTRMIVLSAIEGGFEAPFTGGRLQARVTSGGVDISDQMEWSIEYTTRDNCGGTLSYTVPFFATGPAKIDIFSSSGTIPIGVYQYRIKARSFLTNQTFYSATTYSFSVRARINTAPILNVARDIDSTLDVGQVSIPYLEIMGTAEDACTDIISEIKWEQLEGPPLQNYDAGNGKLIMRDAPIGTYVFRFSAKDNGGLTSQRTVNVYIRKKDLPELMTMRAFSPNEDGIDDTWNISNIGESGNLYSFKIINQHGKMIYEARPPYINDVVWDGTLFGKPLPDGAYYFIMTDKDKQEVKRGSILLVR